MTATSSNTLATTLLDLHLQHELAAFSPAQFIADMEGEIDAFFALLQVSSLKAFVDASDIKAVIKNYAIDLPIHAGITELVGELVAQVFFNEDRPRTPCKALISSAQIEAFVDKALELTALRRKLVGKAIESSVYTSLVAEILYSGITQYVYDDNLISKNIPGVSSAMKFGKRMMSKGVPGLENAVAGNLKKYISSNVQYFIGLSESFLTSDTAAAQVKETLLAIWDQMEEVPMIELRELISTTDVQDFIVLGHEFWLKFRKTPYFEQSCHMVVDYLFEKYGDEPLAVLVDDMGVTPAMAKAEIARFAPNLLERLRASGFLEARLRNRLAAFYESAQVQGLLAGHD